MTRAEKIAYRAASDAARAQLRAIVATGRCPQCRAPLVRNITLAGWWQCAGSGAPGFRGAFDGTGRGHPEYDALPACAWQGFTE